MQQGLRGFLWNTARFEQSAGLSRFWAHRGFPPLGLASEETSFLMQSSTHTALAKNWFPAASKLSYYWFWRQNHRLDLNDCMSGFLYLWIEPSYMAAKMEAGGWGVASNPRCCWFIFFFRQHELHFSLTLNNLLILGRCWGSLQYKLFPLDASKSYRLAIKSRSRTKHWWEKEERAHDPAQENKQEPAGWKSALIYSLLNCVNANFQFFKHLINPA